MMNKVIDNNHSNENIEIKDIFNILGNYKWFITFIMFLFLLLSSVYLFFVPSIYSSHAIIEVKKYDKNSRLTDDLLQHAFYATNKEIDKEMEILKTFKINQKVIDKINLKTQVFLKDGYKKVEVFGNAIPIKINNINILNNDILDENIKLIPEGNGFRLEIESIKFLFKKDALSDSKKVFSYGNIIKTNYFEFSIKKNKEFSNPIYFKLNGESRYVYENIINKKLIIKQSNLNAPLIWITYEDNIPQRATNYVNKLVDAFLEEGLSSKSSRNDKILIFIKNQLRKTKSLLDASENRLKSYKITNKITNTSLQTTSIISKLGEIEIKIADNQLRKKLVDNILNTIQNNENIYSIGSSLSELGDGSTDGYLASLQKLKLKESELSSNYTDEYPELITVRRQMELIKEKIILNIKNLKYSIISKGMSFKNIKRDYEDNLVKLPAKEITLANLTRDYEINSKMYAYLLKKKSENDMIKVATISDYKVVERAYPPLIPIKPRKALVMLLSLILGLVVGVIIAVIHNSLSNKIKSIEDVENNTTLRLNGIIPLLKKQKGNKIEVFEYPQSYFTESYRKLRTNLQFLSKSNSNIILVTSTIAKEGKSTIITNLGAIFQLVGYKTIVIDLDLRNPSLHKYFDLDVSGGLSGYLSGRENMSDIIFSTLYPNLDIIPVGSIPVNPSELILSDRIEVMLEKLKERYDYILIDSAPIGTSTDTLNLMKYTDINLVIFRANKAKKLYIDKLEKMIVKYNLKNIGLVINAISLKKKNNNFI